VYKLLSGLKELSTVQIEKIILDAIAHKQLQLKISHGAGTLTFSNTSTAATSVETQTAQLGSVLNKVARSITASKMTAKLAEEKVAARKAFLQKVASGLNDEFERYADRKILIENRKEDLEKVQSDNTKRIEDLIRLEKIRREAEEAERLAREEAERQAAANRIKMQELEVLKIQQDLLHKYKINKTVAELTSLTSAQRYQLLVDAKEDLQKQKEDENRRLQDSLKRVDYITRALRMEEVNPINQRVAQHTQIDQEYQNKKSEEFAASFRERHAASMVEKARLAKMQPFRDGFEDTVILQKQRQEFERVYANARRKAIIEQREKRLAEAREQYAVVLAKLEEERQRELELEAAAERERLEQEQYEAARRERERAEAAERERAERLAEMERQIKESEARKAAERERAAKEKELQAAAAATAAPVAPPAPAAGGGKYVPPSARSTQPPPAPRTEGGGDTWRGGKPSGGSKAEGDGGWTKVDSRDTRGGFGDNRGFGGNRDGRGFGGGDRDRERDNRAFGGDRDRDGKGFGGGFDRRDKGEPRDRDSNKDSNRDKDWGRDRSDRGAPAPRDKGRW
jgi:DNA repair exonuclease SbcCD ATPase subunit